MQIWNIFNFDFKLLRDSIMNNKEVEYLIMSKQTLKLIQKAGYGKPLSKNNNIPFLLGVPIAICENLTIGEIILK